MLRQLKFIFLVGFLNFLQAQEIDLSILDEDQMREILLAQQYDQTQEKDESKIQIEQSLSKKPINMPSKVFGVDFINSTPTSISAIADLPLTNDYRIALNDQLIVVLSGTKKKTNILNVGLDGSILMEDIGKIQVVGETFESLRNKLKNLIDSAYVGVDVDLSVKNLSAKKIIITGAVEMPGTYIVNPFTTVSTALAYSGGIFDYASLRNIKVITPNGDIRFFDLYDILIYGDRSNDYVLNSGDTLVIESSNNFVEIKGGVHRPMIYEYKETDSYEELINFALGLRNSAISSNITSVKIESNSIVSSKVNINDIVNTDNLEEIFVGTRVLSSDKEVFVGGSGVTNGYFSFTSKSFKEFLANLNFSNNIYPFYAIYEQELDSGLTRSKRSFSLADPETYEDFKITKNSNIYFYDRDYILAFDATKNAKISAESILSSNNAQNLSEDKMLELNNDIEEFAEFENDQSLQQDFIQIKLPGFNIDVPVSGRITPRQLHSFFGKNETIDISNVATVTIDKSIPDSYDLIVDSKDLVALTFPAIRQNLIEVTITGQVLNPGTYSVSSSADLNSLYILSGGLLENAFNEGIALFRKSVKENQIKAIKESKAVLTDSLIQKSTNLSSQNMIDIEAILQLADLIQPNGRVSGDFSAGSFNSINFNLKDGDSIVVPASSNEVVVQGEVLNSSSFVFEDGNNYLDYIDASGGFSSYADKRAVFIIRANGESIQVGGNLFMGAKSIKPGDTIVVPRDLNQLDTIPAISLATKIISDIAFSAASLNAIQN